MPDRGRLTTNTTTDAGAAQGGSAGVPYVTLFGSGTWGGGTLKLQAGFDSQGGMLWVDVPEASLTANGCVTVAISAMDLRVSLAGATAPSLDWAVV